MRSCLFAVALLMATPVLADNDPNRPTDKIAADLDIEEAVFIECFKPVNPEPVKNPTGTQQRTNKALLLPCLQAANPAITNDKLDAVINKPARRGRSATRRRSPAPASCSPKPLSHIQPHPEERACSRLEGWATCPEFAAHTSRRTRGPPQYEGVCVVTFCPVAATFGARAIRRRCFQSRRRRRSPGR